MPTHPRFTNDDLDAFASEHLSYEIAISAHTAAAWSTGRGLHGRTQHSALTVAGLVHLRLLDDFLGMAKPKLPDDVLAVDYSPSWAHRYVLSSDERKAINGQVQHLAMRRDVGRKWALVGLTNDVLARMRDFIEGVPDERRPAFDAAVWVLDQFEAWTYGTTSFENLDHHEEGSEDLEAHYAVGQELVHTTSSTDVLFSWPYHRRWAQGS